MLICVVSFVMNVLFEFLMEGLEDRIKLYKWKKLFATQMYERIKR